MNTKTIAKGTILIVDDNLTNLDVMVDHLGKAGFKVLVATSGQKAIEQTRYVQPDLILLDVLMPGLDGFETCRRLKDNETTKDIPVIFMTALSDAVNTVKGFEVGAVDYITKPVRQEEITARVTVHLSLRQAQIEIAHRYQQEQERRREAEQRRRIAESLGDILAILNSNRPLADILDYIVSQTNKLLGTNASICSREQEGEPFTILAAQGLKTDESVQADISLGYDALQQAASARRPVAITDIPPLTDTVELRPASNYHALLAVPLMIKEVVYGGIILYYNQPRVFSDEELELAVAFSDQAALAIENARLRDQVEQAAVITERNRLARDLHDAVTQTLFSASLIAVALPSLWERDPAEARRNLEKLRQLTRGALAEMRTLLLELRPTALAEAKLGDLLRHLSEAMTGRTKIPAVLTVEGDCSLPADVQIALYRIAQETLNNIARHARANQVTVSLKCRPGRVMPRISDDGCGFDPHSIPPDHLGISIMQERARVVGVTLEIESRPGQGTEVAVVWEDS